MAFNNLNQHAGNFRNLDDKGNLNGTVNVKSYNASGSSSTTTGTITSGTNIVTLTGNNVDFKVGQGVIISGIAEVASLQITSAATSANNVTITLNGTSTTVAVASGDTAIQVADKIRAAAFSDWTTGGTAGTNTVTFTCNGPGNRTDATYSAGSTGAAGTMTTTTQGVDSLVSTITNVTNTGFTVANNASTTLTNRTIYHDDRVAIQAAFDGAPSGSTVIIPPGQYNLSKGANNAVIPYGTAPFALKISKPLNIIMYGATLKTTTVDVQGTLWVKSDNVTIKGGTLLGDYISTNSVWRNIGILIDAVKHVRIEDVNTMYMSQGINATDSEYCLISNCRTESGRGSGIISYRSKHTKIDTCEILNHSDGHLSLYSGLYNHAVNCRVYENRSGRTGEQGITVEYERSSVIEKCTVHGFFYGIDAKNGATGCVINGNKVYDCQINISVRSGDPGNGQTPPHGIRIVNNDVTEPRDATVSPGQSNYCISLTSGTAHVVANNILGRDALNPTNATNTMSITALMNVNFSGGGDDDFGEGTLIEGNQFLMQSMPHSASADRIATGIGLKISGSTLYTVVKGNQFRGSRASTYDQKGIVIDNPCFLIEGNVFQDFNKANSFPIHLAYSSGTYSANKYGRISGNMFEGQSGAMIMTYAYNVDIMENTFSCGAQFMPVITITNSKMVRIENNTARIAHATTGDIFLSADSTTDYVYARRNHVVNIGRGGSITNSGTNSVTSENVNIASSTL